MLKKQKKFNIFAVYVKKNEAKDSSAIENIVTTHDSIYEVLTESGYKEDVRVIKQ